MLAFETRLAELSYTAEQERDVQLTMNRYKVASLDGLGGASRTIPTTPRGRSTPAEPGRESHLRLPRIGTRVWLDTRSRHLCSYGLPCRGYC